MKNKKNPFYYPYPKKVELKRFLSVLTLYLKRYEKDIVIFEGDTDYFFEGNLINLNTKSSRSILLKLKNFNSEIFKVI